MGGLAGGLLGAGLFGMLTGHGFFGGIGGLFGRRSKAVTPEGEVVDVPVALEAPADEDAEATRHAAE